MSQEIWKRSGNATMVDGISNLPIPLMMIYIFMFVVLLGGMNAVKEMALYRLERSVQEYTGSVKNKVIDHTDNYQDEVMYFSEAIRDKYMETIGLFISKDYALRIFGDENMDYLGNESYVVINKANNLSGRYKLWPFSVILDFKTMNDEHAARFIEIGEPMNMGTFLPFNYFYGGNESISVNIMDYIIIRREGFYSRPAMDIYGNKNVSE